MADVGKNIEVDWSLTVMLVVPACQCQLDLLQGGAWAGPTAHTNSLMALALFIVTGKRIFSESGL